MSGHSKWSTIKHKKGAADAKRAAIFTKLAKAITVAAKAGGGDPEFNFSLRTAVNAALAANMTKDAIERAIKRGSGAEAGDQIEEVVYEGYGPGGVAVLVEALTDNRNRTSPNVKHHFTKHGGNLGASGSVQFLFDRQGVVRCEADGVSEAAELALIDAGADDIGVEDGEVVISGAVEALQKLQQAAEGAGLKVASANLEWTPKELQPLDSGKRGQLEKLFEALDDDEDVQNIYYNVDL
jgi:YebC/PmpR family DNA-binding regulatory protein